MLPLTPYPWIDLNHVTNHVLNQVFYHHGQVLSLKIWSLQIVWTAIVVYREIQEDFHVQFQCLHHGQISKTLYISLKLKNTSV